MNAHEMPQIFTCGSTDLFVMVESTSRNRQVNVQLTLGAIC